MYAPGELPAPLLPEIEKQEMDAKSFEPEVEPTSLINLTLEDYLSTSDNMSLLSLDMSSQNESDMGPESLSMYRYVPFWESRHAKIIKNTLKNGVSILIFFNIECCQQENPRIPVPRISSQIPWISRDF